jgi:predicted nucleic acid-binding protein
MTATLQGIFADTPFWIALVVKQDHSHDRAQNMKSLRLPQAEGLFIRRPVRLNLLTKLGTW